MGKTAHSDYACGGVGSEEVQGVYVAISYTALVTAPRETGGLLLVLVSGFATRSKLVI
jgi:hypothetical protein